jgi:hypothetical protein
MHPLDTRLITHSQLAHGASLDASFHIGAWEHAGTHDDSFVPTRRDKELDMTDGGGV